MVFQFVLTIILILATLATWRRLRQQAIRAKEACGWTLVWIVAAIVIWQPSVATRVAHAFGIGRGADFVLYAAVIVLLLLVFHLHVAHDRLERKLTTLVRKDALRDLEETL